METDWLGYNYWWERAADGVIISIHKESMHIFFDTNFLMALGQFARFNLTFELDRVLPGQRVCVVLSPIIGELEKLLNEGSSKVRKEAQIALTYAKNNCQMWPVDYTHKNVDFILLHYAQEYKGIVATNDRLLKKIARKKGIKTLFIRNQSYLMIL